MKKNILVLGILILLLLFFETQNKNTIEDAMEKANINVRQILHQVETDKGIVVFYEVEEYPYSNSIGLVGKSFNKYKWIDGGGRDSFDVNKDLTCGCSNIGKSNEKGSPDLFQVAYGIVANDEISEVKVTLKGEEAKNGTIVETELGRIWYLFLDEGIRYVPRIKGLDSDGEIVFE
ncbi:hypothetical protein [Vallitalea guaymasensis]|uniref:Uncharacterized protein n=1 Tax=Vallitalea guaymasensis TaxID=1185412 RepID=A0A8J8M7S1_9FIRM|nr:hypothetical protein [Vallitalea guaymasensis]QUH27740.1 hypothetical protein HYG85_01925 [Vallitalea guaymasensis]